MSKDFTTKSDVKDIVTEETKSITYTLGGIILVLFIGFITMFLTTYSLVRDTYIFRVQQTNGLEEQIFLLNENLKEKGLIGVEATQEEIINESPPTSSSNPVYRSLQ